MGKSEVENRAKFDIVRYAQCWEDADLLLDALNVVPGEVCLSIASAGDNSFSLLTKSPVKVYATDLNFTQIACCTLRKAMYKNLTYDEFLDFAGVLEGRGSSRIEVFNEVLKKELPHDVREYWEKNISHIENGFMKCGKFEHYFEIFRKRVLPLIHSKKILNKLVEEKTKEERYEFYEKVWANRRWNMMFNIFFSRFVMGRLGRDKEFFKYVEGSVAKNILNRTRHALCDLDPSVNPYLRWIVFGHYTRDVLPHALRKENYDRIRENIDNIEFRHESIESFLDGFEGRIDAYNLSDIFEYMSEESMESLYKTLLKKANTGARLAYWNMLAPRNASYDIKKDYNIHTDEESNSKFLYNDKAFFYSRFVLEVYNGKKQEVFYDK